MPLGPPLRGSASWTPAFAGMTFAYLVCLFIGSSALPHGRDDALARDGQVAHAHAERVEDGVGDGAGDGPVRGLAGAERLLLGAGR